MDTSKIKEYVDQTIKDAGNIDQFNLKTMLRLLPLLTEYYVENDSQRDLLEKALDGDQNSFDELANKFDASLDEQKAFQKYIKYNKVRRMTREKEKAEMFQESSSKGSGFEFDYPHIWFSLELEKINKILRYLSLIKMQKGYHDTSTDGKATLSLKTGIMQIRKQEDKFQLIVPVISGCFNKNGVSNDFAHKHIIATYSQDEVFYDISIFDTGFNSNFHELKRGGYTSESDIGITDSDFLELIRRFPGVIGYLDVQMKLKKDINITIRTVFKWDGPEAICLQLYVNTRNNHNISYTTHIHCPTNTFYIRNAPILYRYMREMVISKLQKYGLNSSEFNRIVTDDVNGVTTTDHLHLRMDGRNVNFFNFCMKLSPNERAIEIWIKGEVEIGYSPFSAYHNFEMCTRVFYDVSCDENEFRTIFRMKKNKDYYVWANAKTGSVENKVRDSGTEQCKEIEKQLNSICFEWEYPFLINFSDIQMYDNNGYMSLKYSFDI